MRENYKTHKRWGDNNMVVHSLFSPHCCSMPLFCEVTCAPFFHSYFHSHFLTYVQYQFSATNEPVHFFTAPKNSQVHFSRPPTIILKDLQGQCNKPSVSNNFYFIRMAHWNGRLSYLFNPYYNFSTRPQF